MCISSISVEVWKVIAIQIWFYTTIRQENISTTQIISAAECKLCVNKISTSETIYTEFKSEKR